MKLMELTVVALACLALSGASAEESAHSKTNAVDKHRKAIAHIRAKQAARVAACGGYVTRPLEGRSIVIVNEQKRVPEGEFFKANASIADLFQYSVRIVPPGTDVGKEALVITLSDNDTAPALLVAPEVPWAGVNVGALAADKPTDAKLAERLRKEIWRAFMYACGAANSPNQPCVMRPIFGLRDLDGKDVAVPNPDSLMRVEQTAAALGVAKVRQCLYSQACQEGWAPPPTNDVQKAIWQKTLTAPKTPIKIEFDPKKGR